MFRLSHTPYQREQSQVFPIIYILMKNFVTHLSYSLLHYHRIEVLKKNVVFNKNEERDTTLHEVSWELAFSFLYFFSWSFEQSFLGLLSSILFFIIVEFKSLKEMLCLLKAKTRIEILLCMKFRESWHLVSLISYFDLLNSHTLTFYS